MKNLFTVLALFVITVSCKKSSDYSPEIDLSKLPKIDSIATNTEVVNFSDCPPSGFWGYSTIYKFDYDSLSRITQLNIKHTSNNIISYSFTYNQNNQVVKMVSKQPPYRNSDSILLSYPSPGIIESTNYRADANGFIWPEFLKFEKNQNKTSIYQIINNNGFPDTILKMHLHSNANGDIDSALYLRHMPSEKNIVINEFYTNISNPYYSVYQRLGLPLFYLTGRGLYSIDLTQALSKHCIKTSNSKMYCRGSLVTLGPPFVFPESIFEFSSGKVVRINSSWGMPTYFGGINRGATIAYK